MKAAVKYSIAVLFVSLLPGLGRANNIEAMNLAEVYSLSQSEVEAAVMDFDQETCDELIAAVTQGVNDPAKLTPAQFCAIQNYSNGRYVVNRLLWETDVSGSKLNGMDWAYVRVLDSALAKIKNSPPTVVFRGTSRNEIKFTERGQIVRLKGYSSTSPNREVAEGFIRDRLMIIKALSGKNIKNYSNAGSEDELLLPRSTLVRFDHAELKILDLFTEEGPEKREVEIVYLTEVPKR